MKNNNVSGSRRARGQRILSGRRKRLIKQRAITILPSALLALFFLGVTALICTKIPDPAARTATSVTVALLYIPACAALTVLTSALKAHRSFILDRSDKATDTAVLDALLNHRRPIVIFDEGGIIRWINNSFASVCVEGEEAVGASVAEICGFTAEDVLSPDSEEGYDYHRFGRQWGVKGYRLTLDSRRCIMAFFNDRTEVSSLYMQIQNESPVVCYIMIDNLEELMQYVQEQYRTIAGEVETVLKSWAESVGGIFREYEKERYMFIFEARHLEEFAERRFDILDRVREVRVGDGSMPVSAILQTRSARQRLLSIWRCSAEETKPSFGAEARSNSTAERARAYPSAPRSERGSLQTRSPSLSQSRRMCSSWDMRERISTRSALVSALRGSRFSAAFASTSS